MVIFKLNTSQPYDMVTLEQIHCTVSQKTFTAPSVTEGSNACSLHHEARNQKKRQTIKQKLRVTVDVVDCRNVNVIVRGAVDIIKQM